MSAAVLGVRVSRPLCGAIRTPLAATATAGTSAAASAASAHAGRTTGHATSAATRNTPPATATAQPKPKTVVVAAAAAIVASPAPAAASSASDAMPRTSDGLSPSSASSGRTSQQATYARTPMPASADASTKSARTWMTLRSQREARPRQTPAIQRPWRTRRSGGVTGSGGVAESRTMPEIVVTRLTAHKTR